MMALVRSAQDRSDRPLEGQSASPRSLRPLRFVAGFSVHSRIASGSIPTLLHQSQ